jgi:vacuolar-type H+-ATPase subunit I/STV1
MKNVVILLSLFLCICLLSTSSYAQKRKKSKEDKAIAKEWKKKAKSLDPLEYKSMVEEQAKLKAESSELNAQILGVEERINSKDTQISRLQAELKEMQARIAEEQASNVTGKKVNIKGVVFKVQIGAFRNKDLTKYFDNNQNFSGDVDQDGVKKYTIGYFGDYWEADTFKKYLRAMGVKDAWIVPYKDGQRVNIKDVLEGAI